MTATFRWLWFGAGAANLGDGLVLTALPLIALGAGAAPGEIALVTTLMTLAWPVFGLHAGWIVDRIPVPRLLVLANAARVAAVGTLAAGIALDGPVVPLVFAAALVYGVAETVVDTSLIAVIPAVVRPSSLTAANSRMEATVNLANQLAGPPLAGLLVGVSAALAAATGSMLYAVAALAALVLVRRIPTRTRPPEVPRGRVREGIAFLWRHPLQRDLTLLTAAMNLVWSAWAAVFVVHAVAPGPLALTPAGYGWLLTAMAAGGVAASLVTNALQRRFGTGALLFADCLGTIALVLPSALGADLWVVAAGLVIAGAGSSVWRILVAVIRQQAAPPELLGRVYAASRVISWGALPLGSALAGLIATIAGVETALIAASVVAVAVAVVFVPIWRARMPRTRPAVAAAEPTHTEPSSGVGIPRARRADRGLD
ncbi:MFS transporter [Agromyces bauzanensis]